MLHSELGVPRKATGTTDAWQVIRHDDSSVYVVEKVGESRVRIEVARTRFQVLAVPGFVGA